MKRITLKIIIFFLLLFLCSGRENISVVETNDRLSGGMPKHRLTHAWAVQSLVGIFGLILNGLLLKIFISAKATFTTSINLMIW